MARILIVDDDAPVRSSLERLLGRVGHSCVTAADVAEAAESLDAEEFDLVLLDVVMPGGSGLDLLRSVTTEAPDTAVIMVTGVDDRASAAAAINTGAYGYVLKPFGPNEIEIAILNALRRRDLERERRQLLRELGEKVSERTVALREASQKLALAAEEGRASEQETVDRLHRAVSLRHDETGRHIERVGEMAELLADRLGFEGAAPKEFSMAASLHDVGKIGVPDTVLLKPGSLTADEYLIVQRHTHIGYRLMSDSPSRVLGLAASIALSHHERWDGAGYPRALRGDAIPFEGRITAVVDAFDAMTHRRVYRKPIRPERAVEILRVERGRQFDGEVVDAFITLLDEVMAILDALPEEEDPRTTVLLVDDHRMFAEALLAYLAGCEDILAVGVAGTVEDARRLARESRPDVVLLDNSLPDGNGVDAIQLIKAEAPSAKVLMLTGATETEVLVRALQAGCAGYLTKGGTPGEIERAIRRVQRDESVIPAEELSRLLERLEPSRRGLGVTVTSREREVLSLLAKGFSTEEITARLALSPEAVSTHLQRVLEKMDAHSGLEAVTAAVREGVIELAHH